jgi:peptide chain release factor 1
LPFLVPEVFGRGKGRESHARPRARRLVHLPVYERGLVNDAALLHLHPEVVAFPRPFAHAAEDRKPAVLHGDVVYKLHDEHGLAHARAAEEADLAAGLVRGQEVHHLDAGLEDLL